MSACIQVSEYLCVCIVNKFVCAFLHVSVQHYSRYRLRMHEACLKYVCVYHLQYYSCRPLAVSQDCTKVNSGQIKL